MYTPEAAAGRSTKQETIPQRQESELPFTGCVSKQDKDEAMVRWSIGTGGLYLPTRNILLNTRNSSLPQKTKMLDIHVLIKVILRTNQFKYKFFVAEILVL